MKGKTLMGGILLTLPGFQIPDFPGICPVQVLRDGSRFIGFPHRWVVPLRHARDGSRPQRTAPQRCDYVAPSPITCNFMRTALRTTALRTGYFMRTSLRTGSFAAAPIAGFLRFFCPELDRILTAAMSGFVRFYCPAVETAWKPLLTSLETNDALSMAVRPAPALPALQGLHSVVNPLYGYLA